MVMPLGVASRVRWRKAPRTRQVWVEPRLAEANAWHGPRAGLVGDGPIMRAVAAQSVSDGPKLAATWPRRVAMSLATEQERTAMLVRLKLRVGAGTLLAGAGLAALGELVAVWNANPLTRGWFVAMVLIALGTVALLFGVVAYALVSDDVDLVGFGGAGLLALGGFALILGTVALDLVVVPLLFAMAATIAGVLNAPGSAMQTAVNSVIAGLNAVGSVFGGGSVPSAKIPQADGTQIVSSMLTSLHLPTIAVLTRWGRFFSSGGPLTLGCLVLGYSLLKRAAFPRPTSYLLAGAAGLNLLCQLLALAALPPAISDPLLALTGVLLFAALALFAATILFPREVARLWSTGGERLAPLRQSTSRE
jgi:hypothetical protein